MLSYQHIYHAGNHADVLKHTTLVMLLEHLNVKQKPYTVIDTHAGSGRYGINDKRALKTRDADTGINRLLQNVVCGDNAAVASNAMYDDKAMCDRNPTLYNATSCAAFAHYRDFVKACSVHGFYPGSPEIARSFMRRYDNLILCELHKAEVAALKQNMKLPLIALGRGKAVVENAITCGKTHTSRSDAGHMHGTTNAQIACATTNAVRGFVHVHCRDGFDALTSLTPPKIKRGLVLVDPSYEDAHEYERVPSAFASLFARWSGAIFALWYPLLFHRRIECSAMKQKIIAQAKGSASGCNVVLGELCVNAENAHKETGSELSAQAHLYGSGMLVVNAPWKLAENMKAVLPYFAKTLGIDGCGSWSVDCF
ncbi:MAG: 23S rRNA (adenine(2030)-N(6))-methyltransferase RlmJ [Treponema sp.]|nr:23S rRNA (adenine(2030)-N(6))-methyltransferase RlmJ [Treponema sp.]